MRRKKAILAGAGLMLAASVALAGPAAAQVPVCAGTAGTVVLCIDPTGTTLVDDCVYVGPPPCMNVTVPGPTISCGGRYGTALCASFSG